MSSAAVIDLKINCQEDVGETSSSATFLDYKRGLLITNGLIFIPLFQILSKSKDPELKRLSQKLLDTVMSNRAGVIHRDGLFDVDNNNRTTDFSQVFNDLDKLCTVTVYVQNDQQSMRAENVEDRYRRPPVAVKLPNPKRRILSKWMRLISKRFFPGTSDSVTWKRHSAQILAIWRNAELCRVLDRLINPNSGWMLLPDTISAKDVASAVSAPSESQQFKPDEDQIRAILPVFILLKIDAKQASSGGAEVDEASADNTTYNYVQRCISTAINSWDFNKSAIQNTFEVLRNFLSKQNHNPIVAPVTFKEIRSLLLELCKASFPANVGEKVCLISTPFGSLSPSVFLNSISEGIVANVAGENNCLIITDARCVPGCEGGAMLAKSENGRPELLGIIVAPFCWRQNEWVGLCFSCSLQSVLNSLLMTVASLDRSMETVKRSANNSTIKQEQRSSSFSENVGLVKIGSRWGSATIVNLDNLIKSKERVFLTCSHVVQSPAGSKVKIRFIKKSHECIYIESLVLYSTPPEQVYDVAVLYAIVPDDCCLPSGLKLSSTPAREGDAVVVIGHGLFDDHIGMPATITSGVLSKILYRNGQQVLLQSTCAVHPGVSGGALFNLRDNVLCGIVVCNARDSVSGASYPHINLSIPSTIVLPALKQFVKSRDVTAFEQLFEPDVIINSYWQLGFNQQGQELTSKL